VDALSLCSTFPCSNFDWATVGYSAGFDSYARLDFVIFPLEPLAMAQGTEAVFWDGSVEELTLCALKRRRF